MKDHANNGWQVVISIPDALYFDMPYAAHPDEGGYYWAIRSAPTRKLFSMMPENLSAMASYSKDRDGQPVPTGDPGKTEHTVLGIQGQVWTETIRDRETLGYQIFPRLLALAERAWHKADWEVPAGQLPLAGHKLQASIQTDWNRFASILTAKELPKLEAAGWAYRLPPPGVSMTPNGVAYNAALPGLPVQCNVGAGWLAADQCDFKSPVSAKFRVTNEAGNLSSRVVEVTGG